MQNTFPSQVGPNVVNKGARYKLAVEGVKNAKLAWCGTFFDFGGYALMNRNYVRGLEGLGWPVGVEAIRGTMEISEKEREYFNSRRRVLENGKGLPYMNPDIVKVVAHLPLWNIPRFKHNIIYSMMESKDTNQPFIERCNEYYDSCWTPTEYNKKDFIKNGMTIPVSVMPIGVDNIYFDDKYKLDNVCFNYEKFGDGPDNPEGFKFLSVFRWSFRKGFDVLIKSYLREFSKKDNVSLVIFSRHAAMSHDQRFVNAIREDINKLINEYGGENAPTIYWCSDRVDQELMPSMYNVGDVFVSTSRGEGFCIPALEASQTGLPVIAPFHTGFTDYLTEDNSYKFDVDEWVVCNDIPDWKGWITRDFYNQEFPRFGDKSIDCVRELMRRSMENTQEGLEKNQKMKDLIRDKYTWSKCVEKADSVLKAIM